MEAQISPVEWQRIGIVFDEAVHLDRARRAEFVAVASEGNALILNAVQSLLASDEATGCFLDSPIPLDRLRPAPAPVPADGDARTLTMIRGPIGRSPGLPVFSVGEMAAGRFRIVRMLGAGGMGEVYEAEDLLTSGARIALKTISARLDRNRVNRDTFREEVLAARSVTHPGVCRVHELHDDPRRDGLMFLTMELLDGPNLAKVIRSRKEIQFNESARQFLQIAESVAAAHRAGILHCDIKSSNVIMVPGEKGSRPVVTDFGLARVAERSVGHVGAGTPEYMAPELFNGAPASFATDVYSLGILAVELLTGERLPHQLSELTGLRAVPRKRILPAGLQRGAWGRLVARCLHDDPARRFSSAAHLAAEVGLLLTRGGRLTRRAALATLLVTPLAAYYTYGRLNPPGLVGVAILPFEDRTAGHNFQFLAESIPGEIIRALSRVPSLKVTAQTSTSRFRGAAAGPVEIARRLNVDYVVRGTVDTREGSVVMYVEALSGKTGRTIWKDEFRQVAVDNLRLREEAVLAVAGALPIALAPAQLVQMRGQPTSDSAAYDKYLIGMQLAASRSPDGLRASIDRFIEAGQMDPGFALAFAAMSISANSLAGRKGYPADEYMGRSEAAVARALRLDDSLPEAHLAMGTLRQRRYFDWAGAESEFRTATRLNPGLAQAHQSLAGLLSNLRRIPEALAEIRLARSLDPVSLPVNALYGAILVRGRQPDEAIHQLELTNQLGPSYSFALPLLGEAWAQKGMWKEAGDAYERSSRLNPGDDFSTAGLAYVYARAGRTDEALSLLDNLLKGRASQVAVSQAYVGLNRFDEAIQCLEAAWEQKDPTLGSVAAEPYNDPLRQFPRFSGLLHKMSLP